MSTVKHLLQHNGSWSKHLNSNHSPCLSRAGGISSPKYLWIGCVDNYCIPHEIVGVSVDEVLVYKNLAHQVNYTDLNCLSILQYAIQILSVKHVIVCGHYNCILLRSLAQLTSADLVEQWLHPVRRIHQEYQPWLAEYQEESLRVEKICELNVIEQVIQLCKLPIIQNAWEQRRELTIHGWVYSSDNGLLKDLELDIGDKQDIFPKYQAAMWECIRKSRA